jgi:hypothetical protein
MLNNSGAGATVNVASGVTALQQIQCNLTLADNAVFNIAPTASLLITVGKISGAGDLSLTGGGSLTIDTPSTYVGNTTVTNGTLSTTATGTVSTGALTVVAADAIHSTVNLGNDQTVSALSGTVGGAGATARVNVTAATTLSVNQAASTVFQGVVDLAVGNSTHGGGTLTKSAAGSLEIQSAPALRTNSNLNVAGGVLRFNVGSGGPATVGSGVLATVSNDAVLELAGSIAALSDGTAQHAVAVLNNSTSAAGLHVTGTNQQVGGIDGTGTTQVEANASLTANHIVQNALVIGGVDAVHAGRVTIDTSDANGNPLASSNASIGLAGEETPTALGDASAGSGLGAEASNASAGLPAPVPEPPTFILVAFGLAVAGYGRARSGSDHRSP